MNALIVIDMQNDFTPATARKPAGALAVAEGHAVTPIINRLAPRFDVVVATQDWHPPDHRSFASQHPGRKVGDVIEWQGLPQVLWPDHCVQQTFGAQLLDELDRSRIEQVFRKGTDRDIDSYSGFFDNGHRKSTGLDDYLKRRGVRTVYLAGLTTDFCVKFSVLDALKLGYETHVVRDACRAVNLQPGDEAEAIDAMRRAGAKILTSDEMA